MKNKSYVLTIDEGTTSSTALLIDNEGRIISRSSREIQQIFPQPGWVEQDPVELFQTSLSVAREAIQSSGVSYQEIKSIGITGQRETTIVWDRKTGQPVSNAIVWQCRRTAPLCEYLRKEGLYPTIQDKTGLIVDAYFSATKLRWILDNIPQGQQRANQGELLFGTVDCWLVWKLTGGTVHVTDHSNASRTMLFNIKAFQWDKEILNKLNIPENMLPKVMPSCSIYGETVAGLLGDNPIPIGAIAGDQQASLFGQACFEPGMAKNTYGTGSFILMNTGDTAIRSNKGLITTIAWGLGQKVTYAMEGSIFVTGSAVQWLRDGLKIIENAAESENMARSVKDNGGVYFVPALTGLGAPYWDMYARGTLMGITRGTTREHIVRATLEAIAYQSRDVLETMKQEANLKIPSLRVDGGGTANEFLMQFQADILGIPIQCASVADTTALGAAYLAGMAVGIWKDQNDLNQIQSASRIYEPRMGEDERNTLCSEWKRAVRCALNWSENGNQRKTF